MGHETERQVTIAKHGTDLIGTKSAFACRSALTMPSAGVAELRLSTVARSDGELVAVVCLEAKTRCDLCRATDPECSAFRNSRERSYAVRPAGRGPACLPCSGGRPSRRLR